PPPRRRTRPVERRSRAVRRGPPATVARPCAAVRYAAYALRPIRRRPNPPFYPFSRTYFARLPPLLDVKQGRLKHSAVASVNTARRSTQPIPTRPVQVTTLRSQRPAST